MKPQIEDHQRPKRSSLIRAVACVTLTASALGAVGLPAQAASGSRSGTRNGCTIKVYGSDASPKPYSYTQDVNASCFEMKSRTRYYSAATNTTSWGSDGVGTGSIVYSYGNTGTAWSNSVGSSSTMGYAYPVYVY